jgi:hypothetical protein
MKSGFKVLTHDHRPPIQGGDPVWDGETLPFELPTVTLNTSSDQCAAGWNYTGNLADALRVGGLWPRGRPAVCVVVEASDDAIERGNKRRCSQLTIVRRASEDEIAAAIADLSQEWFGEHAERMAQSQLDWFRALGRPEHDEQRVEADLQRALDARGLQWTLKRYDNAWDAWDARDALTVEYSVVRGWIDYPADLLTVGIRDAYTHGLAVAIPTGRDELGWAMEDAS